MCKIAYYKVINGKRQINRKIAAQLEITSPSAKRAYQGAIYVINAKEYVETWVHCAHSLREAIDLSAKTSAEAKPKWHPARRRFKGLQNLAKKMGVNDGDCCRSLVKQYKVLSEIAHHRPWTDNIVDKRYANSLLTRVENNLKVIFNIKEDNTEEE